MITKVKIKNILADCVLFYDDEDDFPVNFYNRLCKRIERLHYISIKTVEMEIFHCIREFELSGDLTKEEAEGLFNFICFHIESMWDK